LAVACDVSSAGLVLVGLPPGAWVISAWLRTRQSISRARLAGTSICALNTDV
jgi:hypothetical protein